MPNPSAFKGKVACRVLATLGTGIALGVIIIIVTVVFFGHAAQAQTDPGVAEFLALVNRSLTESAGESKPQSSLACGRIVTAAVDMDAVSRSALTHMWDHMSPRQRAAYRAAAHRWATRDCLRRIQDNSGRPLEFLGVRKGEDGERLLATRSSQTADTVIWRLRGSEPVRAIDVVIGGRSLVLSLRDETTALLDSHNGDFDKATAALGR